VVVRAPEATRAAAVQSSPADVGAAPADVGAAPHVPARRDIASIGACPAGFKPIGGGDIVWWQGALRAYNAGITVCDSLSDPPQPQKHVATTIFVGGSVYKSMIDSHDKELWNLVVETHAKHPAEHIHVTVLRAGHLATLVKARSASSAAPGA
jgi:hypothetical protein